MYTYSACTYFALLCNSKCTKCIAARRRAVLIRCNRPFRLCLQEESVKSIAKAIICNVYKYFEKESAKSTEGFQN